MPAPALGSIGTPAHTHGTVPCHPFEPITLPLAEKLQLPLTVACTSTTGHSTKEPPPHPCPLPAVRLGWVPVGTGPKGDPLLRTLKNRSSLSVQIPRRYLLQKAQSDSSLKKVRVSFSIIRWQSRGEQCRAGMTALWPTRPQASVLLLHYPSSGCHPQGHPLCQDDGWSSNQCLWFLSEERMQNSYLPAVSISFHQPSWRPHTTSQDFLTTHAEICS